jgi:addiction module RelE/StbE family toxin
MGAYKVVFSPYADRDLERIVRYISRDNPGVAENLGRKLISRALSLAEPGSALIGSRLQKRPDVRSLIEGNYLIFYRVFPEHDKVRILRFWHAARNPKRLYLNV